MFDSLHKKLLILSTPIIMGMISQNILNIVDMAMVGNLGKHSLAAIGIGHLTHFLAVAILGGIPVGVQAIAARRFGAGKTDEVASGLKWAIIVSIISGIILSSVYLINLTEIVSFLNPDKSVRALAISYLSYRLIPLFSVGMNHSFRGMWNGVNAAKNYLIIMVIMHSTNILLNYIFIYGNFGASEMGIGGAGLASAIATVTGTFCHIILITTKGREFTIFTKLKLDDLKTLLRLALPTGIQQLLFSFGLITVFYIVGKIGVTSLASMNILTNTIFTIVLLPIGLGLATSGLIGQSLGRIQKNYARIWHKKSMQITIIFSSCLGLFMLLFPNLISSVFSNDIAVVNLSSLPMRITGIAVVIESIGMILLYSLFGAGSTLAPMVTIVSLLWFLYIPGSYVIGVVMGHGLLGIWILQLIYKAIQAAILFKLWHSGNWSKIKV